MTKLFKKILMLTLGLAMATGVGLASGKAAVKAEATITGLKIRIAVVRPTWWAGNSAYQPLRIANTTFDLTNNYYENITYVNSESWVDSTYYSSTNPSGSFSEYDTDGILFYDVFLSAINGKYFDLARLPNTELGLVWNHTPAELYTTGLNTSIWRIWDNGAGVTRPAGTSAESRNIDNAAVSSILYGYLTCSTSADNGYEAYASLRDNFNLEGRSFTTETVLDYEYFANYSAERTGITVPTVDKINAMKALYNIAHPAPGASNIGSIIDDNSIIGIILVGVIGLTTIGCFYFLTRKKAHA